MGQIGWIRAILVKLLERGLILASKQILKVFKESKGFYRERGGWENDTSSQFTSPRKGLGDKSAISQVGDGCDGVDDAGEEE